MNERESFIKLPLTVLLKAARNDVETVIYKRLQNGKEQVFILDKDNIILAAVDVTHMSLHMVARKVICALQIKEAV